MQASKKKLFHLIFEPGRNVIVDGDMRDFCSNFLSNLISQRKLVWQYAQKH